VVVLGAGCCCYKCCCCCGGSDDETGRHNGSGRCGRRFASCCCSWCRWPTSCCTTSCFAARGGTTLLEEASEFEAAEAAANERGVRGLLAQPRGKPLGVSRARVIPIVFDALPVDDATIASDSNARRLPGSLGLSQIDSPVHLSATESARMCLDLLASESQV
jgi:hypothetical protein